MMMRAYTIPALAFLIATTCVGIADARIQNGLDGLPSGNPTSSDNCYDSTGGSVRNKCAAQTAPLGWYLPLVIDNPGVKAPIINARGLGAPAEFPQLATKCRGYRINLDGTVGTATAWEYFDTGVDQEKTLGPITFASVQSYLVGCYLGGQAQLNTIRYAQ